MNNPNGREQDNPAIYATQMEANEKGQVEVPPQKYSVIMGKDSIEPMVLTHIGKYDFVKGKDGKIYRKGENGIEYPPISKEDYDKIVKARKELEKVKGENSARKSARYSLEEI